MWPGVDAGVKADVLELVGQLEELRADAARSNARAVERTAFLEGVLAPQCVRALVPRADADIRDLQGLFDLGPHLA